MKYNINNCKCGNDILSIRKHECFVSVYSVECLKCKAKTYQYTKRIDAIKAWNKGELK
jgi:predicted SprT family Zn-dependent metalloprotease